MEELTGRYTARVNEFESRVNQLIVEYDNLLEHVPLDLSECCTLDAQPELDKIHVTLGISTVYELPPIVEQRIKETFKELFPDGKFS